jgi:hypothetical protein
LRDPDRGFHINRSAHLLPLSVSWHSEGYAIFRFGTAQAAPSRPSVSHGQSSK